MKLPLEQLAGLAIEQGQAESGGALAKSTKDTEAVLDIYRRRRPSPRGRAACTASVISQKLSPT